MLPDGFEVLGSEGSAWSIRWAGVSKVFAYKFDNFAFDTIYICVQTPDEGVDISEDDAGFKEFVQKMSESLSPFKTDWRYSVVRPAFERCETVLYPAEPLGTQGVDG